MQQWLMQHYPQMKVSLSQDKVGTSRLREVARHADFSVLITQCATHAATSFINQHAREVVCPKGAGSVSVVRAVVDESYQRARPAARLPTGASGRRQAQ
ncbi:hypothetical protein [Streptomyces sp. NPDC086182]|uniref:hypothetical protein n=1 Tax=Streptomyces sp. NPDC086182 TaxID=3155058 RepID=UPI003446E471